MTPERQKWWDSLPGYEKQARNAIKDSKRKIKWAKEELPDSFGYYGAAMKDGLRRNKFLIKALRKEIAMDVIALHNSAYEYYTCPYCGQNVREGTGMRDEDRYCASCGQKLRWQE